MPTARKLKSGSWHCVIFSHYEVVDGVKKRKYESFTCSTPGRKGKAECERMAAEWSSKNKRIRSANVTVQEALERYLSAKENVLSPSTMKTYTQYKDSYFEYLGILLLRQIDDEDVQEWVSELASTRAPKTVKNIYNFFTATCKMFGEYDFKVQLPQKKITETHTPSDDEVKLLLQYLDKPKKAQLRRAVMLSAFCSLRRGEISALTDKDIVGNRLLISKSIVRNKDGVWVTKTPKTTESYRYVDVPDFLLEELRTIKGPLVGLKPHQITNRFVDAVKYSGCPHFRFHDLRHYYVSISHALGIPDAYIMECGGWKTDHVMKTVYLSTMDDRRKKEQAKLQSHFSAMQNDMQNASPPAS